MKLPPQFNPYSDSARADSYAKLGIVNTYYLAYRDLPKMLTKYGISGSALDFGCGTGRSTRFLRDHGFSVVGVDISAVMIAKAREQDPEGEYSVIDPGNLDAFADGTFDLVLSVMPFDNIPTMQEKVDTLEQIGRVLKPGGFKILVATSHEVYLREWVSFTAADYPENHSVKSGEVVRVVIRDLGDRRVVEDVLWTEPAYHETFQKTKLQLLETRYPIAEAGDEYRCEWISELTYAPWLIFVLRK